MNIDRGNLTDTHSEHPVQQGMQQLVSDEFLDEAETTVRIPVEEQPHNPEPLNLIHDVRPSEDSLRIAVQCQNVASLDHLWEDYCSGHLNHVAEELLVTDDIKRRFNVESVKLKTSILEEDYLACKEHLLNRPGKLIYMIPISQFS